MALQFWLLTIATLLPASFALDLPFSNIIDEGQELITDIASDVTQPLQNGFVELITSLNFSALTSVPDINIDLSKFDLFKKQKTFTELASEAGVEFETHYVTTEDGYILTLFHAKGTGENTTPVLLMHGFIDNAESWVHRRNNSFSRLLVDNGYDVWLGNCRGNRYSRNHTSKDADNDKDFWDFSFHEIGVYDLPALIDYVLNQTAVEALHIIGHSQGNQIMYVMASEKPEYNDKVKMAVAMAPISFLQNLPKSLVQVVFVLGPLLEFIRYLLDYKEFIHNKGIIRSIEQIICPIDGIGYEICLNGLINPLQGYDNDQLDLEFYLERLVPQTPCSTSTMNALHFVQIHNSKKFRQYDRGIAMNLKTYNSVEPPEYDLSKITMKVVLMVGLNDYLATPEDAIKLRDSLPNVEYMVVDDPKFAHLDFVWGKNAASLVYEPIIKLLKDNP